jgi:hypothetical protein
MSEPGLKYPREALFRWWRSSGLVPEETHARLMGDLVDTLFFASLAREEGQAALARIVYHEHGIQGLERTREHERDDSSSGPELAWSVIPLNPIRFTVKALAKLTPAANVPRTAVVVGPRNGELHILGLARRVKRTDGGAVYVFSAPEPGFLVMHFAGEEILRYERGSLIAPEQKTSLWKALHSDGLIQSALKVTCQKLIQELPPAFYSEPYDDIANLMFDLINTMVAARHGGLIAIQTSSSAGREPTYPVSLDYRTLLNKRLQDFAAARKHAFGVAWARVSQNTPLPEEEAEAREAEETTKETLASLVENIGRLTAMDNALLLGPELEVLGAGFAVSTPEEQTPTVYEARDPQGTPGPVYDIGQHGSRHRAAVWFAHQNPGGLVFMVSQDGPLRCLIRPSPDSATLLWNLRLAEF